MHVQHGLVRDRSVILQDIVGGGSRGAHYGAAKPG